MMGTSNQTKGGGAWVRRVLMVVVIGSLIVIARRSRARGPEPVSWSSPSSPSSPTAGRAPRQVDPDGVFDPEVPERDALDQRQEAVHEPVDDLPNRIPPEQPEADVLEQRREVSVDDDEPQVIDEPPRDG